MIGLHGGNLLIFCVAVFLVVTVGRADAEPLAVRLEARVHRCIRAASPGLVIPVGNFDQLAKVEACGAAGMRALRGGKAPASVKDQINGCVDHASFPDSVMPSVNDFKACIVRVLT